MNKRIAIPILALILILIDFYAFEAIKVLISPLSAESISLAQLSYWSLSVLTTLGLFMYHFISPALLGKGLRTVIMVGIFAIYMAKTFLILGLLIDDVRRVLLWIWSQIGDNPVALERSFWVLLFAAGMALATLIAIVWGIGVGAHNYEVRKKEVYLPNLPQAFDGFKVLQISDVHSGTFWSKSAVAKGIDLIREQGADVIFFTGDLVNNLADEMDDFKDLFAKLDAEYGVYSILGNHDYGDYVYWPSAEAKAANLRKLANTQKEMGWDLLINEHRILEKEGERIAVIGIENWGAKARFPKYGDLAKAYTGTEDIPVKLLLSHDPSHWLEQVIPEYPEIDITFSGHTHGMQFGVDNRFFKWSPVKYVYPQWADLYKEGSQYLYVNRGFGYLGFPGRVGIRPEITVLTLKKGHA